MEFPVPPGAVINVRAEDGHRYSAQVMVSHEGFERAYLVRWIFEMPRGCSEALSWIAEEEIDGAA